MKEILTQYAQYNVWANKLVIDAMLALPTRKLNIEIESSFPTIKETALHVWSAEYIWLERLKQNPEPLWIQSVFIGLAKEMCNNWQRTSGELVSYIAGLDEAALKTFCSYSDRSGHTHTTPVWQVLQHVFNHSTYHRGQLITMLRQAGATEIPGTDFIGFARMHS